MSTKFRSLWSNPPGRVAGALNGREANLVERQTDATDQQIDHLVYDLYGLTADEIEIVEESTS